MRKMCVLICLVLIIFSVGCAYNVKLFPDASDPLLESTIKGQGPDKVLVINIQGIIMDLPMPGLFRNGPSMVQEVVAQLRKCESDPSIKAVILKIDSPGGTVSASDNLYHEILSFKKRSGVKVVVMMMSMATSGGYYISLPADVIIAQPGTITGSIGAKIPRYKLYGLLDKIGAEVTCTKSGRNKDILSPFRPSTEEEDKIIQDLIDAMGKRFMMLVNKHRKIKDVDQDIIASARVFIAEDAEKLGLVDKVGHLDEAIREAGKLAGLKGDFKIVAYRRSVYEDDNLYNTSTSKMGTKDFSLLNMGALNPVLNLKPGFYYMWLP